MQTHYKTKDFIKLLPIIIEQLNSRKHGTTKVAPKDALKEGNEELIWHNLWGKLARTKPKKPKFQVSDWVKILAKKSLFTKSSIASYSTENFQIVKRVLSVPSNFTMSSIPVESQLLDHWSKPN